MRQSYEWIDNGLGGRLARLLLDWRSEGAGYRTVVRRLGEAGFHVSRETVRRWYLDLDREAREAGCDGAV